MKTTPARVRLVTTRALRGFATRLLGVSTLLLLGSCTHLGPHSIPSDRFDYSSAVADSWKQQTLLNIVKLRYMDLPVFVDVASIVAGYSMETTGSVGGQFFNGGTVSADNLALGASGKFTDRPTITYVPLTGEKFLRGLVTPIDPKLIFFMLQSGYAADFILGLSVESINGVRNRSTVAGAPREADPDFLRALELLREVQAAGGFGMRMEGEKTKGPTAVVFFRREDVSPEILEKAAEVRRLLNLPADAQRLVLTYSPVRGGEGELAVNSRSMLQVMIAFASYLDVPREHLDDHSAVPSFENSKEASARNKTLIHSSKDKPANSFAAVHYRDHWFWIDEGDWQSKRALTTIMFLFTIAETGGNEQLPLITIPAQ
jgi:hypothetical protein